MRANISFVSFPRRSHLGNFIFFVSSTSHRLRSIQLSDLRKDMACLQLQFLPTPAPPRNSNIGLNQPSRHKSKSRYACHLVSKGLLKIACTSEGGIGSKRKGRHGGRRDPRLDEKEEPLPFLEKQERMIKDFNRQVLVDVESLLAQSNNKFGLVLEISEEANDYLRDNKDESLTRKPVLKVISDRINQGAGENITDSYIEETSDPTD